MDRLTTLRFEPLKNILCKFDLPEVTRLKLVNRTMRNLISSHRFAKYYNKRLEDGIWTVTHFFTSENDNFGTARFVRENDGKQIDMQLQPLLAGHVYPDDPITFLCVSGSLLLFRVTTILDFVDFVAVNPFSRQVFLIEAPNQLASIKRRQVVLLSHPVFDFGFVIRCGQLIDDTPIYCEYDSVASGWGGMLEGILVDEDEQLDTSDSRNMILTNGSLWMLSFLVGFVQPEFKEYTYQQLFDVSTLNLDFEQQPNGMIPVPTFHFGTGGDGFAVLLIRHFHPAMPDVFHIRNVCLFQLAPDWSRYNLVSVCPHTRLPFSSYRLGLVFPLEVLNGKIRFILPSSSHPHSYSYLHFTYDLANDLWRFRSTPLIGANRFPAPSFTSHLTIRT